MKKIIITIAILFSLASMTMAQVPDSTHHPMVTVPTTNVDSLSDALKIMTNSNKKKDRFNAINWLKEDYPNPKKALLLSVIPGMGQAYNKKYWKIPIVYAAIGGLIFVVDLNNRQYNRLQTAYLATVDDDETTISEFENTPLDNATTLRTLRDGYDKNRQLSWFGLVAVYLLGGIDAFVDGHLLDFDVSDDLSLKVKPDVGMHLASGTPAMGIGLHFQW